MKEFLFRRHIAYNITLYSYRPITIKSNKRLALFIWTTQKLAPEQEHKNARSATINIYTVQQRREEKATDDRRREKAQTQLIVPAESKKRKVSPSSPLKEKSTKSAHRPR